MLAFIPVKWGSVGTCKCPAEAKRGLLRRFLSLILSKWSKYLSKQIKMLDFSYINLQYYWLKALFQTFIVILLKLDKGNPCIYLVICHLTSLPYELKVCVFLLTFVICKLPCSCIMLYKFYLFSSVYNCNRSKYGYIC